VASLSVVIVTYNSAGAIQRTLPALAGELREGDELIVVDNDSSDGTSERARELAPSAQVIESGANLGYGEGSNRGAAAASGDVVVFLNPDAMPQPGFRDAIVAPAENGSGWAAWQGIVTAKEGTEINTSGGVAHFTGIAWAGAAGAPITSLPSLSPEPAFVSGACLAVPRAELERTGGYAGDFFLYHEDVDLSFRVRLAGGRLGVARDAVVDHEYDFDKGRAKWRYLERNRWATLIRTYPGSLLALLMPALIATDLALWPVAIAGGWGGQRLRALADTIRGLPRHLRERGEIQRTRTISAAQFAAHLSPGLDSAYLGAASRSRVLGAILGGYWRAVRALLR
jgi:N-acetylglucosaminyl-diphospho-decaprenol L-rhamnosyltransferase